MTESIDIDAIPDDPDDPYWSSLPDWVTEFRPHQFDAVLEIVDAYRRGMQVVELDAPVGSGKTLIGEMVRVVLGGKGAYVCTTRSLQDQIAQDFDCAVVKGRANYPTILFDELTAEDCTGTGCVYCPDRDDCPYQVALASYHAAPLGVANTAYLLGQINGGNPNAKITKGRELVVIDECDELESVLVGSVEVYVGERAIGDWGGTPLKKGVHTKTQIEWLRDHARLASEWARAHGRTRDVEMRRRVARVRRLSAQMVQVAQGITKDPDLWVREYSERRGRETDAVMFKPVLVGEYGMSKLWRHAPRFLAMSGTIISPDQWSRDVGVIGGGQDGVEPWGLEWEPVSVAMTFPVENRPIFYSPAADMKSGDRDTYEQRVSDMSDGIGKVVDKHDDSGILCHTVSYALTKRLYEKLTGRVPRDSGITRATRHERTILTYTDAASRDHALQAYVDEPGSVLLAPSMDRGIDLAGDLCRCVIVAKLPFPNLGDRRVAARMRLEGGQNWYSMLTARTLVQMTGRGVRSADDHATSYILDAQFNGWHYKNKQLLPKWWRDALEPKPLGSL